MTTNISTIYHFFVIVSRSILTDKPVRAGAVVGRNPVHAGAPVPARVRPALVPVGLAVYSGVTIDTVAGVCAVK